MKKPLCKIDRFHLSSIILFLAALISPGLAMVARRSSEPEAVEHPVTAEEWLAGAEIMRRRRTPRAPNTPAGSLWPNSPGIPARLGL